ncbi:MAG: AI-2E family transporter, partial [Pseudomonadota bacterium]
MITAPTAWRVLFWAGVVLLTLVLVDALADILLPFVAGMAIAYLLDPAADRLERAGIGRGAAAAIIIGVFGAVAAVGVILFIPILIGQIDSLSRAAPAALETLRVFIETRLGPLEDMLPDFRAGG